MGIRRKNVSDSQRERIEELLDTKTPREVFAYLRNTRQSLSLSSIYKIRKEKGMKVKAPPPSQENKQEIIGLSRHTENVLRLLDRYVGQVHVSYEPEDFITPPEGAPLSEKESAYWFYAKKAVPSLQALIDSQVDYESLVVAPQLEREPPYASLVGHYDGTKLWEDIQAYEKAVGAYFSIGLKLHRTIMGLVDEVFAEEADAGAFRSALTELIREDLAPVRVKLHLEGIETDKMAVLRRLPGADCTSLRQGVELLQRYLSGESRGRVQKNTKLFADLQDLLDRIKEAYQSLRTKERDLLRGLKEERFKGQLPAGSKCKFCPTISGNGMSG